MKHFALLFLMLLSVVLPAQGWGSDDAHQSTQDRIVGGLLDVGGRAASRYLDKKFGGKEELPAAATPADGPAAGATPEKRTWRERGGDMLQAFVSRSAEEMGNETLGNWLAHALKDAVDVLLVEYKEQYKAEGRAYAKELGDKMLERVRNDPKISSSITTLQVLCWCVIAYLTLVTLIMLFSLLRLRRANGRLLAAIDELRRERAEK